MPNVSLVDGHIDGKQTNYDRIRNMSVEDFTDFIYYNYRCRRCAFNNGFGATCGGECKEGIKKWLESEVDTE